MSWLSSALTPPGTNEAQGDSQKKKHVQRLAWDSMNNIKPGVLAHSKFAASLQPQLQRSVQGAMTSASPWGVQNSIDNARSSMMTNALNSIPTLRAMLSARGGGGIGAQLGAEMGVANSANDRANDLAAFYASPEGKARMAQMAQAAATMGMQSPLMDLYGQYANLIYGRPAPQVGASPLASIAGLASSFIPGMQWAGPAMAVAGAGGNGLSDASTSGWLPAVR